VIGRGAGPVPALPLLLGGAAALLVAGALWHPAAPACVAGAGALLTAAAAGGNRFLLAAALGGFALRVLLAALFHMIAGLDLPSLRPLRVFDPLSGYGFWIVARDSLWYHTSAVETLTAWRDGTELPEGSDIQFFIFTALVYRLFGANPLNAVLWNAFFGALAIVAGYRIAMRVAGPSGARVTAILIACWPSAILWSTQLLKDALCLLLILVLLELTMRAVDPPAAAASPVWALIRWMAGLVLVFAVALAVHRFRYYVLLILIPAPLVFVLHALIRPTRRTPWRIAATLLVMGAMLLAASASRRIDLTRLFGSRHPEIAHVNIGVRHQASGDLDGAQAHYLRAITLVNDHPPALKNLAALALARGDRSRAVDYLRRYVALAPQDAEARGALERLVAPAPVVAAHAEHRVAPRVERRESSPPPERRRARPAPDAVQPPSPRDARVAAVEPAVDPATPPAANPAAVEPATASLAHPATPVEPVTPPPVADPPVLITAAPVPVPSEPISVTGPRSDLAQGTRNPQYGDAFAAIVRLRRGFARAGGRTTVDSDVELRGYGDALAYLPRALANVLFTPYPAQWFDRDGSTGPFKALSVGEALLVYLLIVPLVLGLGVVVVRGSPDALYLAVYVTAMIALLGLVISNVGTLFRLRLEALFPLFAAGGLGCARLLGRRR
jgi:tetratricopeptide (TPR) repeat protein